MIPGREIIDGILGYNTRTLGVSRDQQLAAIRQSGGAYHLIMDGPELAAQVAAAGGRVIYRQTGDGQSGGDPLAQDPAAFVAERARNAPAAALIHLTNELDEPTSALLDWTRQAMRYAASIGRKACILNFSTNRSAATWNAVAGLVREAVAGGHAIGLHAYFDTAPLHDAGAWAWRDLKRSAGGLWLVTEFAYIRTITDGGRGWRGALTEQQYAAFLQVYVPRFAVEAMPLCLFSFDDWPTGRNPDGSERKESGFGIWNASGVLDAAAQVNQKYTFKGVATVTLIPTPTSGGQRVHIASLPPGIVFRNIRQQPNASAADVGDLKAGDDVTAYLDAKVDGWVYVDTLTPGVKGWVLWTGVQHEAASAPESEPMPATPTPEPEPTAATVTLLNSEYELVGAQLQTALVAVQDALTRWKGGASSSSMGGGF